MRVRPCEQDAWAQLGKGGLVIDLTMIDEAVRRRQGALSGRPLWRRALVWLPPAVTAGLAAVAAWTLVGLLSSRAIGALAGLLAALGGAMTESSPVTFVPNPYRSGWLILHGQVTRRRTHHTPAGTYDLVHTDLPLTPGDSGSGLYDARGQLVGLNTWRGVGDRSAQGISLPSEAMRVAIEAIRTGRLDQLDNAE